MSTTTENEPALPARIFLIKHDGVLYVTTSVWEYKTSDRLPDGDEKTSAMWLEQAFDEARLVGADVAAAAAMELSLRGQTIPGPRPRAFWGQTIRPVSGE